MLLRRAVTSDRQQTIDEIRRIDGQRQRIPAQRSGASGLCGALPGEYIALERRERAARDRGADPVEPAASIGGPRRRKGGAENCSA